MNLGEQRDDAAVVFEGVSLGYGRAAILSDLTFSIAEGDFLGIIGPNGSGKTTILRAILGMVKPVRGSIHIREGLLDWGHLEKGRLVQRFLDPAQGEAVGKAIMNYRKLMKIVRKWERETMRAFGLTCVYVHGSVCRPGWLIEIEATAARLIP